MFGFSTSAAAPVAQGGGPSELRVEMSDYAFTPRLIVVRQNQPVHFVAPNTGLSSSGHRLTIVGQGENWATETAASGETTTLDATFSTPGTYQLFCSVSTHRDRGMVGTVTVVPETAEPGGSAGVALDEWSVRPLEAAVVAGQTRFELQNVGAFPHALTIAGHGVQLTSDRIEGGDTIVWDTALLEPGLYEMYCPIVVGNFDHRDLGMTGTLEVLPTVGATAPSS
jgi:plastocyanin